MKDKKTQAAPSSPHRACKAAGAPRKKQPRRGRMKAEKNPTEILILCNLSVL